MLFCLSWLLRQALSLGSGACHLSYCAWAWPPVSYLSSSALYTCHRACILYLDAADCNSGPLLITTTVFTAVYSILPCFFFFSRKIFLVYFERHKLSYPLLLHFKIYITLSFSELAGVCSLIRTDTIFNCYIFL